MVGLVPTIHAFPRRRPCSRRGCSPQGRAWRLEQRGVHRFRARPSGAPEWRRVSV